jgi:hypothetical protein
MHNFQIIGGCFVEGLMFGNANEVIERDQDANITTSLKFIALH